MTPPLAVVVAGSGTSWTATCALLDVAPPLVASGPSAARATQALVPLARQLVRDTAMAQGLTLTPAGLAVAELRVRSACSLALGQLSPAPQLTPAPLYGIDVSTLPDLDPSFAPLSGQRAVAEAVARRWLTPLGGLFYDEAYGEDLSALLSARLDRSRLLALAASLQAQAEADERVSRCRVELTTRGAGSGLVLSVKASLTTGEGPFALTLTVDRLSASLDLLRN